MRRVRQRFSVLAGLTLMVVGAGLLATLRVPAPALAMQAGTGTPASTAMPTTLATSTVAATRAVTTTGTVTATNPLSPTIPAPAAVSVDPKTTALLILDVTNVICSPQRPSCLATVPVDAALLKKARAAGVYVVYSDTGGNSTVLPDVAPNPDEQKVSGRADKFFNTNLDNILKGRGIKTVVIVGYVANGAVLYTAFGANARGYTAVVPLDGTGAEDPFAYLLTEYQLLNEPGFANPTNTPLADGKVTLSRSDLINFSAPVTGTTPAATTAAPTGGATPAATTAATTAPTTSATTAATTAATRSATVAPTGGASAGGPPAIPVDHVGRTQCFVCHLTGVGGAPKLPTAPDHTAFKDDVTFCTTCHTQSK